jgi:type II secretory pathway predicted ATPase ExeA
LERILSDDIFSLLGLKSNPFSIATSEKGYYQTESTKAILEELVHGIQTKKGIMLLVGEVGVGKTSLCLQILRQLHSREVYSAWIFNVISQKEELLEAITRDFGLKPPERSSIVGYQHILNQFFLQCYQQQKICVIIVDEAHNLSLHCLEALRMLSNLEYDGNKLVQILLIGQPELNVLLNREHMRQFKSRVSIALELPQLSRQELKGYVDFKLATADSQLRVHDKSKRLLWTVSRGNLRLVNLIMERALYACVAMQVQRLTPKVMRRAIQEVARYQSDIKNNLNKKNKKIASSLAGILLIFVLATILLFPFPIGNGKNTTLFEFTVNRLSTVPHVPVAFKQKIDKNGTNILEKEWDTALLRDIDAFLSPFDIFFLKPKLGRAIASNNLPYLAGNLPQNMQLIRLNTAPEQSGMDLTIFPWKKYTHTDPEWIGIWKTPIDTSQFHPGYAAPEIKTIQKKLHEKNYLQEEPDGVYGTQTWYALSRFQEQKGLSPTGWPDYTTLYFLLNK